MSETPEQIVTRLRLHLVALDRAMGSGVLTVERPDAGRVTYRSYAEMRSARSDLMRRIQEAEAMTSGAVARPKTRRVVMLGRSGF